jgi:hypothetical protein
MSVVSHLYNGALSDWCEERLTGSRDTVQQLVDQIGDSVTTRPSGPVAKQEWSQSDRVFATRFAALIQPAPPYSALLGLVRIGLASQSWADGQAARYSTHARLPPAARGRALDLRPAPGGWTDLQLAHEQGAWAGGTMRSAEEAHRGFTRPGFPDEPALGELFDRTRRYFTAHAQTGRLSGPGREAGLARLCWLLAAFKFAYRNNSIDHPIFRLFLHDPPTAGALHAAADDDAIADPLALVERLRGSGALEKMRRLAGDPPSGQPWGTAAPVIFDHWDENTFVLNGPHGATLLEVTAAVRISNDKRTFRRVWRLLCDAWLDTADTYRIRTVGFYFARRGHLVTWPLESLTGMLTEGDNPQQARDEFISTARALRAEDHARRLAWHPGRQQAQAGNPAQ